MHDPERAPRTCALPPWGPDARLAHDARWRAHDLLKLRRLPTLPDEPDWVRAAFACAPYAVVRRAESAAGFVAVGVRGAARHARYGTWAQTEDIEAITAPEQLASARPAPERAQFPAFIALQRLYDAQCLAASTWGPTGSAGFELATGLPAATESSDLDLLIRAPLPLSRDAARALLETLNTHAALAGTRVDVQLETPLGGVALSELASGRARVMVRGARGPRLVADPWAPAAADAQERD
jgi:phosphoribosyl-dephospho-CoA transferase